MGRPTAMVTAAVGTPPMRDTLTAAPMSAIGAGMVVMSRSATGIATAAGGRRVSVPSSDSPIKPVADAAGGAIGLSMDAITIQILRNKVASLVEEMHYHFYRSGYSTIIRESRDFSCVILDRAGRLIVAPPMFFHAPVYRHLVGRILQVYGEGGRNDIQEGDVFVSNHPY